MRVQFPLLPSRCQPSTRTTQCTVPLARWASPCLATACTVQDQTRSGMMLVSDNRSHSRQCALAILPAGVLTHVASLASAHKSSQCSRFATTAGTAWPRRPTSSSAERWAGSRYPAQSFVLCPSINQSISQSIRASWFGAVRTQCRRSSTQLVGAACMQCDSCR